MIELVEEALNKLKPLIAEFVNEPINNHNGPFTIKNTFIISPGINGRAPEPDKHKELIKLVVDAVNDFTSKLALPARNDDEKSIKENKCVIAYSMFDKDLTKFKLAEPYLPGNYIWSANVPSQLQIELSRIHDGLKSSKTALETANSSLVKKLELNQRKILKEAEEAKAENMKLREEISSLRTRPPSSAFTTPRNSPPGGNKKGLRENNQQGLFAEQKPAPKPAQPKTDIEYLRTYFGETQAKVLSILFKFSRIQQLKKSALDAYLTRIIEYTKPLPLNFADQFKVEGINDVEYQPLLQELVGLIKFDNQPGQHEAEMNQIHARNEKTLKSYTHLTNEYIILDKYKKFLVRPNKFCSLTKEFVPDLHNILTILSDEMVKHTNVSDELARQQNCTDAQALKRQLRQTLAKDDKDIYGLPANGVAPTPVNGM